MSDEIWIAEFETRSARAQGVGSTALEAARALDERWRAYAAVAGADPELASEYRYDVSIRRLRAGRGYVIGVGDAMWAEDGAGSHLAGDDPSLAAAWTAPVSVPRR